MNKLFKYIVVSFLLTIGQVNYGIVLSQVASKLAYSSIGADVQWFQFGGKAYVTTIGDDSTLGNSGTLYVYEFNPITFALTLIDSFDLNAAMFPGDGYYSNGIDAIQFAAEGFVRIIACGGSLVGGDTYRQFLSFDGTTVSVFSAASRTPGFGKRVSNSFLSRFGNTQLAVATANIGANNSIEVDVVGGAPTFFSASLLESSVVSSQFKDDVDVQWIVTSSGRELLAVATGSINNGAGTNPFLHVYELVGTTLILRATETAANKVARTVRWLEKDGNLYITLGYLTVTSPETVVYRVDLPTSTTVSLVPIRTNTKHVETSEWVFSEGQHFLIEHTGVVGFNVPVDTLEAFIFDGTNFVGPVATAPFGTFLADFENQGSRSMHGITLCGVGYIAAIVQWKEPDSLHKLRIFRLGSTPPTPPTANDDAYDVCTNATNVFLNVLANDIPGSDPSLSIVSVASPTYGSAVLLSSLGILYDTPGGGFTGLDDFDYTIEDGNGLQDTATVSITIDDDAGPTAIDDTFAICAGESVNELHVVANDVAGCDPNLTITSFTQGSEGTVTQVNTTVLNYEHTGATGSDSFTYTIEDGNGETDTATVILNIT